MAGDMVMRPPSSCSTVPTASRRNSKAAADVHGLDGYSQELQADGLVDGSLRVLSEEEVVQRANNALSYFRATRQINRQARSESALERARERRKSEELRPTKKLLELEEQEHEAEPSPKMTLAERMGYGVRSKQIKFDRRCYRRLEQKHHHACKVLDNKDAAFWEESVSLETGKIAVTALGDRSQRAKPYTACALKSRSMRSAQVKKNDAKDVKAKGCEARLKPSRVPNQARTSVTPSRSVESASSRSGEHYKVTGYLHLGLNLKINAVYSKEDLESRCKNSEQKLAHLHFHMQDQEGGKLQLVDAGVPPVKKPRTE
eukprot:Skav218140  [mRNA]  locus=scaffold759:438032:444982:- [translate_table: standard]